MKNKWVKSSIVFAAGILFSLAAFAEAAFTLSAEDITTDGGVTTVTPSLTVDGTAVNDLSGIVYETDSVNAAAVPTADGRLTLTGKINGEMPVRASLVYDGVTYTASCTVRINGQYDRIAATAVTVLAYGNSILWHDSLGNWQGGHGMAASSAENDYIHRFATMLENKYGEGNVSFYTQSVSGFENATNTCTTATDWSSYTNAMKTKAAEVKPDVILLQCGDNSSCSDPYAYKRALVSAITAFRSSAPDAVIVLTLPFFLNDMGVYNGVVLASRETGVPYANLSSLYGADGARATGLYDNAGVNLHPSDEGMRMIAEAFYAKVNPLLLTALDADILYTAAPTSVTVSGISEITSEAGSIRLFASVTPSDAPQDVVWTTSDERVATVSPDGTVRAKNNGSVVITATSVYAPAVSGTKTVTVSGQSDPYTLHFDKNTTDPVTNMPSDDAYAKGLTTFPAVYPERETCSFLGWATAPDGAPVSQITVTSDTTVYAVWEKAHRFTFDREGYKEGFTVENGFNQYVRGGVFETIATGTDPSTGNVLAFVSPTLALQAEELAALAVTVRNTTIDENTRLAVTLSTTNGEVTLTKPIVSTDMQTYLFDLSSLSGTVTGLVIRPANIDTSILLDEVLFAPKADYALIDPADLGYDAAIFDRVEIAHEPISLKSGEPVLVPFTDGMGLVFLNGKTHEDDALYAFTASGYKTAPYYVNHDGEGYYGFTADLSDSSRSAAAVTAFYDEDGRLVKTVSRALAAGERVKITEKDNDVLRTASMKLLILEDLQTLRPLFAAEDYIDYGEIKAVEVDEDADVPLDAGDLLSPTRTLGQASLLCFAPDLATGGASGFVADNRAGALRTTDADMAVLSDVSEDTHSELVRLFNTETGGVITLRTALTFENDPDGAGFAFRDENGEDLFRLTAKDGQFAVFGGGKEKTLPGTTAETGTHTFTVTLDLEKGRARVLTDNRDCGTSPLSGDTVKSFAVFTGDPALNAVTVEGVLIEKNYAVYEDFSFLDAVPASFRVSGDASVADGELTVYEGAAVTRAFDKLDGTVVLTLAVIPEKAGIDASFSLRCGKKNAVTIRASGGDFYLNGTKVGRAFSNALWYDLRIEADVKTATVTAKINGKTVGSDVLLSAVDGLDNLFVESTEGFVKIDDIHVFNKDAYAVPAPQKPADTNGYYVGMNVCSLWKNGEHRGWSLISPFEELEPVLGYYDEGSPETADWEIKYLADHGVDFAAYCWYADKTDAPLKNPPYSGALEEGYFNAVNSDALSFSLIWAGGVPKSEDAFKNYFVPYLIEHYFADDRYMRIDNKAVFGIFTPESITGVYGTRTKDLLDYLRAEVKKLGYDGMIISAYNLGTDSVAPYGFDAWQAYGWGEEGFTADQNNNFNAVRAEAKDVYVVPTVCVGYNTVAWSGERYPMMSASDMASAFGYVKDTYLPHYAGNDGKSWNDKLVFVSNWNEYGEGTVVMPCEKNTGFGYLDAIRAAFTNGGSHTDMTPTAVEKARINHLYPQDLHLLKAKAFCGEPEAVTVAFTSKSAFEAAAIPEAITVTRYASTGTTMRSNSADPVIHLPYPSLWNDMDAAYIASISITASGIPSGDSMQLFFATDETDARGATTAASNRYSETYSLWSTKSTGTSEQTFTFKLSGQDGFSGKLLKLRLDPVTGSGVTFTVRSVAFTLTDEPALSVNGQTIPTGIRAAIVGNTAYFPVEPHVNYLPNYLFAVCKWNPETAELTLARADKTAVFTVGSSTAYVDGASVDLGAKVIAVDGVPLVPIEGLANAFGFTVSHDGTAYALITPEEARFDAYYAEVTPGKWRFDRLGNRLGWKGEELTLSFGYERLKLAARATDPRLMYEGTLDLDCSRYTGLQIVCRWDIEQASEMCVYFKTDTKPAFSEATAVYAGIGKTTGGAWRTVTIDLSANAEWSGTLTGLRFDPFNCLGNMEIKEIRLI